MDVYDASRYWYISTAGNTKKKKLLLGDFFPPENVVLKLRLHRDGSEISLSASSI